MEQTTQTNSTANSGGSSDSFKLDFSKIIPKATAVLTDPKGFWTTAKSETSTIKSIYSDYLVILVGLAAVCQFIGGSVLGYSAGRIGLFSGLLGNLIYFLATLAGVYVSAIVLEKLSPRFEGKTDTLSTFKLVAYSMTAALLGATLMALPLPLMWLAAIALVIYSLYTFFNGITQMTGVPEARKVPLLVTSALVLFVINVIIHSILIRPFLHYDAPQMEIGGRQIDMKALEDSAKALQRLVPKNP